MNDTYEKRNRIREALAIRNMKQVELSEKIGIARGTISNWAKQKYQPKANALAKMANLLDVSELWLAGYDVPMERPEEQKKSEELAMLIHSMLKDEDLKNLFLSIYSLNDDQKSMIAGIVKELSGVNSLH